LKQDIRSGGNWTPVPEETGRLFRRKLDTRSGGNWTSVPAETGRLFRRKLDTRRSEATLFFFMPKMAA
jgi:hypothetical protein